MRDHERRVEVSRSGDATSSGGYANTGVHIGDVNLRTGAPVRTRYRHTVKRIAPKSLVERDAELAELAEFCTAPAGTYLWWQGPAWSGKSALMSWFVLHPPEGVRVVSFFVTARLAGQNDRAAFIENLMEQLLALLGEDSPPTLTETTREAHLLGLLSDAAHACRSRGERFVLLVDGLDEDQSVRVGHDAHSIAALLPASPPAEMRIIVASRPDPPIPTDVDEHHPLRDGTVIRQLVPSPKAHVVRDAMERDLERLLETEQDLLGLVAAAGGGLSAGDLAEITGRGLSKWQVSKQLQTVAGRSFARRGSHYQRDEDVYLLGHEEIQAAAEEMLGPARLGEYREHLHDWAKGYQTRRWPPETPEYLLRGYYNMLKATGDVPRMVACATDPARQDRLLSLSGGDTAGLAEIGDAQDAVAAHEPPDLIAMVRLAIHRDYLVDRNSNIPADLPSLWVLLGQPNRAESLANSITQIDRRVHALTLVVEAAAEKGDLDHAVELFDRTVSIARSIGYAPHRKQALASLTRTAAGIGDVNRAEAVARSFTEPEEQAEMLAAVAKATAKTGDFDRAETIARSITEPGQQAKALASVTEAAIGLGEYTRAATIAAAIAVPWRRMEALVSVAEAAARAGEFDHATELVESAVGAARSIDAADRIRALWSVAEAADKTGGHGRAGELVEEAASLARARTDAGWLARVAMAAAGIGESDRAAELIDQAETVAREIVDPDRRELVLTDVAWAVARTGDLDRAESIARSITKPTSRAYALGPVARAAAEAGDFDRAEALARSITDPGWRERTLADLAGAAAEAGDLDRAKAFAHAVQDHLKRAALLAAVDAGDLDQVEDLVRTLGPEGFTSLPRMPALGARTAAGADKFNRAGTLLDGSTGHTRALMEEAKAAAGAGDLHRAGALVHSVETIVRSIVSPDRRGYVLAKVAKAAARIGEFDVAETVAFAVDDSDRQAQALAEVANAAADAGQFGRVKTIAQALADPVQRTEALVKVAEAAAGAGEFDVAEAVACDITDPERRIWALYLVVKAAAGAGAHDRAAELIDRVKTTIGAIAGPFSRSLSLGTTLRLVAGVAAAIDDERAENIARSMASPAEQVETLASAARGASRGGDPHRGAEFVDRAERIVRTITDRGRQAETLASLAGVAADIGAFDRAAALVSRAQAIARTILDPDRRTSTLTMLARTASRLGDHDRAAELIDWAEPTAHAVAHSGRRGVVLGWVAMAVYAEDLDRAEAIACSIPDLDDRVRVMEWMVSASADAGDHGRAAELLDRATALAQSIEHPSKQAFRLKSLAELMARADDLDRAEATIRSIPDHDSRDHSLESLVTWVADSGDFDRAEAIARSISNTATRAAASVAIAERAVGAGSYDRAADFVERAIDRSMGYPIELESALTILSADPDHRRRARIIARVLRLDQWHSPIQQLLELMPEALTKITAELAAVGRAEA